MRAVLNKIEKNLQILLTRKNYRGRCTVAFSGKCSNFDAVNCKRFQITELERKSIRSNCDVFFPFTQLFIRVSECSISHCITQQYAMNIIWIPNRFPRHRDRRGSEFADALDVFWRPSRSCEGITKVLGYRTNWLHSFPLFFLNLQVLPQQIITLIQKVTQYI